jgi:hypothetical protein
MYLPNDLEHAAILFIACCALGVGYPTGFLDWLLSLVVFTFAIEIAQRDTGRHVRLFDL